MLRNLLLITNIGMILIIYTWTIHAIPNSFQFHDGILAHKNQDSLDQCPMPINADQNHGIDPKCLGIDRHWLGSMPVFRSALIGIGHWSRESCKMNVWNSSIWVLQLFYIFLIWNFPTVLAKNQFLGVNFLLVQTVYFIDCLSHTYTEMNLFSKMSSWFHDFWYTNIRELSFFTGRGVDQILLG